MSFADHIDVFYGRVTHSLAQVYVRVSSLVGGAEWSIAGRVRGPNAPGIRTLPTTFVLEDLGAGATLLGSCSIPDPSFWTTQLPSVYDVEIELRRDNQVIETASRSLGIRFLGASGRDFLWQGKRWVLRGVSGSKKAVAEVVAFQDNAGVIVTRDPSDALLRDASAAGVLVVVELTLGDLVQELRRLSRWPAIAIVILPRACEVTSELRTAAPNVLLAERIDASMPRSPADWAQVVFSDANDERLLGEAVRRLPLPIVAQRRLTGSYTLVEARRECDRLQRDLVSLGDFAGYVVQI